MGKEIGCTMSSFLVFYYLIGSLCYCGASYHSQYRVPQIATDIWESYEFDDQEYIIQKQPVKWEDAEIICRGHHNGSLAILDTAEKAEFLAEVLAETQLDVDTVWVGARRRSADDAIGYKWFGNVPLRRTSYDVLPIDSNDSPFHHYPSWLNRTHVPVPDEGADCVALDRVNHDHPVFLDLPCVLERPFACVRDSRHQVPVTELKVVRCKAGLYHVFNGRLNWDQAAAYCVMRKMSLANIASMKCLKKLGMTMLKTRPSIETAWIGARGTAGKWSWMDNGLSIFIPSPLIDTDPLNWPPLRDRNALKQSGCLQLDRHSAHPPVFLEGRCERKMQFICYENTFASILRRSATLPPSDDTYYYILEKQPMIWQTSFRNCEKMNGSLAMLDTNEILIELLLLMGENEKTPIDHIWISGRLNMTKDPLTDINNYTWYNPVTGKIIPDKNSASSGFIPWLDEEYSSEAGCLNLDRQNHLGSLVYGLPCDTLQPSICMIEKSRYSHEGDLPSNSKIAEPVFIPSQTVVTQSMDTSVQPPTAPTLPTPREVKPFVPPAPIEKVLKDHEKELEKDIPLSPPENVVPAPSDVAQDLAAEATNLQ